MTVSGFRMWSRGLRVEDKVFRHPVFKVLFRVDGSALTV